MNKSAEISKDGRTLTVNTFKDLKHFLDRVLYKHFQITVDKPIKELIIKDSKTDWTVNYVKELLRNAALQTVENFEIISPDSRFCTIDVCDVLTALHRLEWLEIQNPDGRFCTINGILYSRNGKSLYFCPREREGSVRVQEGTEVICKNAFSATNISELIIPDSVKRIQEFACGDNHVLEKVIGGKGIVSFGQYAFFNCVKLTELSLTRH